MFAISATEETSDSERTTYTVTVARGDNEHEYDVTVHGQDYERITKRQCSMQEFVEKAFRYLLERESPSEIMHSFDIMEIQKYFKDFEMEVMKY